MNFCVFTSNRDGAVSILNYLIEASHKVEICVFEEAQPNKLSEFCNEHNIRYTNYQGVSQMILNGELPNVDFAFSYLYHKIIRDDVLNSFKGKAINFHPSLVQVHKGVASFCYCLLHGYSEWGVTAHYLVSGVDEGDIIMQRRFAVPENCYGIEFEMIQQQELIVLFKNVVEMISTTGITNVQKQDLSEGEYYSQKALDADKTVSLSDKSEDIDRKIKALWYPPYHGANIVIDGKKYSLVNEELLKELAKLYGK